MTRPRIADGGDCLQLWRVVANLLNKQSRTVDKGWSSSVTQSFGLGFFGAKSNSDAWN